MQSGHDMQCHNRNQQRTAMMPAGAQPCPAEQPVDAIVMRLSLSFTGTLSEVYSTGVFNFLQQYREEC